MGLFSDSVRAIVPARDQKMAAVASAIPTWDASVAQYGQQHTPQSYTQLAHEGYMLDEVAFACIEAKSTSASEPRMGAWRGEEKVDAHPSLTLLNNPNPFTDAATFWAGIVMSLDIGGNAYIEKVRSASGKLVELWLLRPDRTWVIPDAQSYIRGYRYRIGDKTFELPAENVIHFKTRHPLDDYYGLPPLSVLAGRIDLDVWCRQFAASFFRNAGVPAGLLNIERSITAQERELIKSQFRNDYGGPQGWNNTMVIGGGTATYQPMGLPLGPRGTAVGELDEINEARICTLPTMRVMTKRGMVLIPEIQVGDEVLTHQSRWRRVTATYVNPSEGRPIVEVRAMGFAPLRVTADHPVYAAHFRQSRSHKAELLRFGWTGAGCLMPARNRGEFDNLTMPMLAPTNVQSVALAEHLAVSRVGATVADGRLRSNMPNVRDMPATVNLNPALGRLLGFYLAEGSTGDGKVIWYFAADEHAYHQMVLDDLRAVFGAEGYLSPRGPVTAVVVQNALLARFFACGTSHTKRIPEWAWEGGTEFRAAMLQAWAWGDGSLNKSGWRVTTMSNDLAWSMRVIAVSLGLPASIRQWTQPESSINGRALKSGGTAYTVAWTVDGPRTGMYRFDGTHLTTKVRSVTPIEYDGPVYNLEVEEDHSYLTDGGMVHNCMVEGVPPSVIATRIGLASSSYANRQSDVELFWDGTLAPIYRYLGATLTRGLRDEYPDVERWAHDLSTVQALMKDEDKKHARAREDWLSGLKTWREARVMMGETEEPAEPGMVLIPTQMVQVWSSDLLKEPEPLPTTTVTPAPGGGPQLTAAQRAELLPDDTKPKPALPSGKGFDAQLRRYADADLRDALAEHLTALAESTNGHSH